MNNHEWYVDWFNSPYYHLLYNHRNDEEANFFIDNLCRHLHLEQGAKIWDLACGKGRHAIALNKKGYNVTGTDLAGNSIREAAVNNSETLEFLVHDMREPFRKNYFDAVFNLFTSIGYFEDVNDNYSVFKDVALALKPGGVFVIDFFNSEKVKTSIKAEYVEKREKMDFMIKKRIEGSSVIKTIEFDDNQRHYKFEETVSLLNLEDFKKFAAGAGMELTDTFGNYNLEPFEKKTSDRLILIFKK